MSNVLICGSIAYDSIMVFNDYFKNHILPDQIHKLSVSFYVPELKKNFGGTAGNIAYNLSLLNTSPLIMATVGEDFQPYTERLSKYEIIQDYIKKIPNTFTAQAYITTDLDDNQITAFHPGAMSESHQNNISSITENISLVIIAPDGKDGMIQHANECVEKNIPFLFDPGQGLPMFDKSELMTFINQAHYIALNDYELQLVLEKTNLTLSKLASTVDALIVTKGSQGSSIYSKGEEIIINAIPIKTPIDPTGCGDAYRAGLIYGILNKYDWAKTGQLASVMGAIKIESQGGQNHTATLSDIENLLGSSLK
ncbi:carbohydrate kinase family protein [Methylophilaceae bacterium]|jgi:adenosine kinase|nr:carbohydrate kinase family protein [Methylophilaceae bacterium]